MTVLLMLLVFGVSLCIFDLQRFEIVFRFVKVAECPATSLFDSPCALFVLCQFKSLVIFLPAFGSDCICSWSLFTLFTFLF